MNLNIQDKVILITHDQRGICQYISDTLRQEGALPFIIKHRDFNDFEVNKIDAVVDIVDLHENMISPLDKLSHINSLTPFKLIQIRPEHGLSFKLETDTLLEYTTTTKITTEAACLKTNIIVYSTYFDDNLLKTLMNEIAYTTTFLVSNRSRNIKQQTIFIGQGVPIGSNNHILHQVNQPLFLPSEKQC